MAISNTGSVDLEAVLNVRRRTLASMGEKSKAYHQHNYTDTIYLKREENSNSVLTVNSKIIIFGELQLLCSIFERYTSNIIVYEETTEPSSRSPSSSNKASFSATLEEEENDEEGGLPIVSTLRKTSIASSKESTSPPPVPGSPARRKGLNTIGRSHTVGSTVSEFTTQSLEGKRYGCIQLPNMILIEILEILLRTGLELMNVSSDYDKENVLHQNFIFSKTRSTSHKYGQF
jgi:hypothetical protein